MIAAARFYQATLSPYIGRQCRFVPTCSEYFIEAVRLRGPLMGLLLGAWRILRCNPLGRGGYDPVTPPGGGSPEPSEPSEPSGRCKPADGSHLPGE
ncbi:MAG: membrane protein insertion efficiency factor YidD [Planctomycetes bacterium]|nr:membrane protein insertion efficiency factor YidD [Planctomycetota bacterium]